MRVLCVTYSENAAVIFIHPFSPRRDRNDLAEVLALLKTQIDPELLKKGQEAKPDGEEEKEKAEGYFFLLVYGLLLMLIIF